MPFIRALVRSETYAASAGLLIGPTNFILLDDNNYVSNALSLYTSVKQNDWILAILS